MDKLIFVFNANSGLINGLKDWAHKIISPETYQCSLCTLTYNNLGMRRPWREFIKELGYEVEFLHRDELAQKYGINDVKLPSTFIFQNNMLKLWINSEAVDACKSLGELKSLVIQKLTTTTG